MSGPSALSRVRVRYAETDQMGIAYYANYLVWFEVARTDWLRQQGWTYREMEASGVALPVIEAQCQYQRPARYDDELTIVTRAALLSRVRLEFQYDVRQADDSPTAVGRTVHAAVDLQGRPCRLPDKVRMFFA